MVKPSTCWFSYFQSLQLQIGLKIVKLYPFGILFSTSGPNSDTEITTMFASQMGTQSLNHSDGLTAWTKWEITKWTNDVYFIEAMWISPTDITDITILYHTYSIPFRSLPGPRWLAETGFALEADSRWRDGFFQWDQWDPNARRITSKRRSSSSSLPPAAQNWIWWPCVAMPWVSMRILSEAMFLIPCKRDLGLVVPGYFIWLANFDALGPEGMRIANGRSGPNFQQNHAIQCMQFGCLWDLSVKTPDGRTYLRHP